MSFVGVSAICIKTRLILSLFKQPHPKTRRVTVKDLKRKVYVLGGTTSGVGGDVGETTIDDKWRITVPPDVREGLSKGQTLLVQREGDQITIEPSTDIEKFERELKGCIRGSKIPPKKLKEIWGIRHAHD